MRRACNLDRNHADVVNALEAIGAKVQSLASMGGGVPDLLVGFRGVNVLLEVKPGNAKPSERTLTQAEAQWHATWPGQCLIVYSPEAAQLAVIELAKKRGNL